MDTNRLRQFCVIAETGSMTKAAELLYIISDIPFAVPAQGLSSNPLGIKERDGWLESITPRNRQFVVNLLSVGLELTRQGLCAIFIPKFVARNYPDLIELAIPHAQKAT
jgi:DNA-binding transcriptional LysR family regulator